MEMEITNIAPVTAITITANLHQIVIIIITTTIIIITIIIMMTVTTITICTVTITHHTTIQNTYGTARTRTLLMKNVRTMVYVLALTCWPWLPHLSRLVYR